MPQLTAGIRNPGAECLDIAKQIQAATCFQHDGIRCIEADIGTEAIEHFTQESQPRLFMLTILRKMSQRIRSQALRSGQGNAWVDTQGQCCALLAMIAWSCTSTSGPVAAV